jgi:hypothetical protein
MQGSPRRALVFAASRRMPGEVHGRGRGEVHWGADRISMLCRILRGRCPLGVAENSMVFNSAFRRRHAATIFRA